MAEDPKLEAEQASTTCQAHDQERQAARKGGSRRPHLQDSRRAPGDARGQSRTARRGGELPGAERPGVDETVNFARHGQEAGLATTHSAAEERGLGQEAAASDGKGKQLQRGQEARKRAVPRPSGGAGRRYWQLV